MLVIGLIVLGYLAIMGVIALLLFREGWLRRHRLALGYVGALLAAPISLAVNHGLLGQRVTLSGYLFMGAWVAFLTVEFYVQSRRKRRV